MSIETEIAGTNKASGKMNAELHKKRDARPGVIVYTEELRDFLFTTAPLINSDVGTDMNQNAAFGGTPEVVHVGTGDGIFWTGSNIVGGKANFNSGDRAFAGTKSDKIDNPALNDVWQYDKGSDLVVTDYEGLSMKINIDKDWSNGDSVAVYCWDVASASIVGNQVLLEDFMDEFNFDVWQSITIPFAILGLTTTNFDAIRMSLVGKGGGKAPKFYLDNIQFEESGTPLLFKTETPEGVNFSIDILRVTIVDATPSTLADGTMPGLSYDTMLGVAALTNGLIFQRVVKDMVTFSNPLTQLSDFLELGFSVVQNFSDGTNTTIVLDLEFKRPLLVYGGDNSFLSMGITDDLSGLVLLKAVAIGNIEIDSDETI